jgi:uncharacterized protein
MVAFRSRKHWSVHMFLSVEEMALRKIRIDETFQPGQIDFSGEDLVQGSPLRVTGSAELVAHAEGEARVLGRYSVIMTAVCDRCLGRACFPLEASFDLTYHPMAEIARDEEVGIGKDEVEIGFYEGNGIELEDVLLEQVLLALPMQRVCGEACKGICPVCGGNRNETPCNCRPEGQDERWGALSELEL